MSESDMLQERVAAAKAELVALQVQSARARLAELQALHSQGQLTAQAGVFGFFDDDKWIRVLAKHDKSCKPFVQQVLREYAEQVEPQRRQVTRWTETLQESVQDRGQNDVVFLKYYGKLSAMLDWFHNNLWFLPTTHTYPRAKKPYLLKWTLSAFHKWYCQSDEYVESNDCELELLHALSMCGRLLKRELKASAGHTLEPTFLHDKKRLGWQPCNPKRQRIDE